MSEKRLSVSEYDSFEFIEKVNVWLEKIQVYCPTLFAERRLIQITGQVGKQSQRVFQFVKKIFASDCVDCGEFYKRGPLT